MRSAFLQNGILFLTVIMLSACGRLSRMIGISPYETYKNNLQKSGLAQTALARDWIRAGTAVFSDTGMPTKPPFKGAFYFNPVYPRAALCAFGAKRGQSITITIHGFASDSSAIFVDLFKAEDTSKPVAFMHKGEDSLGYNVRRSGQFLLRLQPELLRGGKVIVSILLEPQLAFPVQAATNKNIQSFFGAPREAGSRRHEGVDIFAPEGTAVLAPAGGRIVSVRNNRLGGKVVSQWDTKRNITYYFAHLSEQIVRVGEAVSAGDTIGLVGNTGNAVTTPAHLHFGIYTNTGAIDPQPYIYQTDTTAPSLNIDEEQLGKWASYNKRKDNFPVRLTGGSKRSYYMLSPNNKTMIADKRYIAPITRLRTIYLDQLTEVKTYPKQTATTIASFGKGQRLELLGRFHDFSLIRAEGKVQGWVKDK